MTDYPEIKDNLSSLNRDYIFQNYVLGDFNRASYQAVMGFISREKLIYNPLIIQSDTGMGKTHLLHAIGNYGLQRKIIKSPFLLNQDTIILFESMIRKDKTIISNIKTMDLFLVDDLDIILKYKSIKRLFELLIDFYYSNGIKIAITTTTSINSLNLSEKTLSILNNGFTAKNNEPDLKDRARLLAFLFKKSNIKIPPQIARYIINQKKLSIRDLKGISNKIFVYLNLQKVKITKKLVSNIIQDSGARKSFIEDKETVEKTKTVTENENIVREEYKEKLYVWEMKGFNIDTLRNVIESPIEDLRNAFITFTSNIQRLIDINKRFGMLNETRFTSEQKNIEKRLFDPDVVDELETKIKILELKNSIQIEAFQNLDEQMNASNYFLSKSNKNIYTTIISNIPLKNANGVAFYIRGKKKTGKTHLLHAIFNKIYIGFPDILIYYINSLKLVRIIEKDGLKQFIQRYSYIDYMIIDNIQNLMLLPEDKWKDIIGFFNTLIARQKFLILASDRELFKPLNKINNITLQTLDSPDFDLKKMFIKHWFEKNKLKLKQDVLNLLAYSIEKNFGDTEERLDSLYNNLIKTKPDFTINDILNIFPDLRIISESKEPIQISPSVEYKDFDLGEMFTIDRLINDYI